MRIGIATGTPYQTYHAVGQGLKALLLERLQWQAWPVVTDGSVENARLIAGTQPNRDRIWWHRPLEGRKRLTEEAYWQLKRPTGEEKPVTQDGISRWIGFMNSLTPALRRSLTKEREQLKGLAIMWDEYIQLVINPARMPGVQLQTADDLRKAIQEKKLKKLRIYIGLPDSVNRLAATTILASLGFEEQRPSEGTAASKKAHETATAVLEGKRWRPETAPPPGRSAPRTYEDAATALTSGRPEDLGAAFYFAGLPTPAVTRAVRSHCRLLHLKRKFLRNRKLPSEEGYVLGELSPSKIPAWTYNGMGEVQTIGSPAILAASDQLPREDAEALLRALFLPKGGKVGQERLLEFHEAAEEIRLLTNLREWQKRPSQRQVMKIRYHTGAARFWERQEKNWLIAAGPLGGTSFRLGVQIAELLNDRLQTSARVLDTEVGVVNTDGSGESIKELRNDEPDREKLLGNQVKLAIVHDDAAAKAYAERKPDRQLLRLIATLYPETIQLVVTDPPHAGNICECSVSAGARQARPLESLQDWLVWLNELAPERPQDRWKFGITRDLWSKERDRAILGYYRDLQGLDFDRKGYYQALSPVQTQQRLLTREITAALVTSGTAVEAVKQLLPDPLSIPRLRRVIDSLTDEERAHCKRNPATHARIRVLGLDRSETSSPTEPDSIQGLVANNPFFRYAVIPARTYLAAQPSRADTVAVDMILACRDDCPHVYDITRALVEDDVRLRSVVNEINLRDPLHSDPLHKEAPSASIPVHREARRYYEEQGILKQLPPKSGVLWERILPGLFTVLFGVITGILSTRFVPPLGEWVGRFNRANRRKGELERRARGAYFTMRDVQEQLRGLDRIWQDVVVSYERRELRAQHADGLSKLIHEYKEQLRKEREYQEKLRAALDASSKSPP